MTPGLRRKAGRKPEAKENQQPIPRSMPRQLDPAHTRSGPHMPTKRNHPPTRPKAHLTGQAGNSHRNPQENMHRSSTGITMTPTTVNMTHCPTHDTPRPEQPVYVTTQTLNECEPSSGPECRRPRDCPPCCHAPAARPFRPARAVGGVATTAAGAAARGADPALRAAQAPTEPQGPHERAMTRNVGRSSGAAAGGGESTGVVRS